MKFDCDVLIAGGGPSGLALAAELGRRNITTIVIDPKPGFHEHPRATYIGPRTLEIFRSWGIIDDVYNAAVPADYPVDICFTETAAGEELLRLSYPSIAECRERAPETLKRYPSLEWSRYGTIVIGQTSLEPVMGEFVRSLPTVQHCHQHSLVSFEDFGDHIQAEICSAGGDKTTVSSRFIIGCDGARSVVREGLGIKFEGRGSVGESVNTFFRSEGMLQAIGKERAAFYWVLKPGVTGVFLAIDGKSHWVFSRHLLLDEQYSEEDPAIAIREALGCDVEFDVISSWPWTPRELVATSYVQGNAILVGDSAHLLSPTGGFGLNTAVSDAVNLAWKLQGVLEGWADPTILKTYETERKPIFCRNGSEATHNRAVMREVMQAGRILATADRDLAISQITISKKRHGKHFDAMGVYLGDRYDDSPVIIDDGTPAPNWDPEIYLPSFKPGGRLPLVWIDAGRTLHDLCGVGFTLFTVGGKLADSFVKAAAEQNLPLSVRDLSVETRAKLGASYLLVRPDGMICWRSNDDWANATAILALVVGKDVDGMAGDKALED